jgi:predicted nucleic acid-binding protein
MFDYIKETYQKFKRKYSYTGKVSVSSLSFLECGVKPMRENNSVVLSLYNQFFQAPDVQVIELTTDVIRTATELRAQYTLPTPDALQAACALSLAEKPLFVTADKGFKRISQLDILLM